MRPHQTVQLPILTSVIQKYRSSSSGGGGGGARGNEAG